MDTATGSDFTCSVMALSTSVIGKGGSDTEPESSKQLMAASTRVSGRATSSTVKESSNSPMATQSRASGCMIDLMGLLGES